MLFWRGMSCRSPEPRDELRFGRRLLCSLWITLAFASSSAAQSGARQVLLLNSFERGSAVENQFASMLRAELGRQSSQPVNFFEVSLQPALLDAERREEGPVVDYLAHSFGQRLDLVITLGGPAAEFAQRYREKIFPATPVLLAAMDQRWVEGRTLAVTETAVAAVTDPTQVIQDILRLLPDTATVFVVIGASPIESLWRTEFARRFQPFANRLTFVWSNGLSFEDTLKRAGTLPPHSAIVYLLLSVDAHGVSQEEERTLAALHAVANAPMFGFYDIQLDRGIVGGSLLSVHDAVRKSASVAVRILHGESPGDIKTTPFTHGQPTFDWRELRRWGISEARLPPGSLVLFRQPSVWDQYQFYIVGTAVLFGLQSALIATLIVQRTRRSRTELALRTSERQFRQIAEQNHDLAGRLINAQDTERTRIARDLHDDVSQQLAGVSIAFSSLKRRLDEYHVSEDVRQDVVDLQGQTQALARNVRQLSHNLHPTVLQHLGLVQALTEYCGELERAHGVAMTCRAEGAFASIAPDAALCVYRIAQEALRNVVAHAGASCAEIRLVAIDDDLEITITDDGHGFDVTSSNRGKGLGLVSVAERAKIAGGTLSIVSRSREGTRLHARIPANAGIKAGLQRYAGGHVA